MIVYICAEFQRKKNAFAIGIFLYIWIFLLNNANREKYNENNKQK